MAVLREPELPPQVGVRGEPPPGFPVEPNTTAEVDGRAVLWLGPDEWLVLGATEADFPDAAAAVDVSANRVAFELSGDDAADVLAQGCSLDLDRFEPGRCAQTLLARAQVILYRPRAPPRSGSSSARRSRATCARGSTTRLRSRRDRAPQRAKSSGSGLGNSDRTSTASARWTPRRLEHLDDMRRVLGAHAVRAVLGRAPRRGRRAGAPSRCPRTARAVAARASYASPSAVRSSARVELRPVARARAAASSPCSSRPRCFRAPTQKLAVTRATTPPSSSRTATWKSGVDERERHAVERVRSGSIVVAVARRRGAPARTSP